MTSEDLPMPRLTSRARSMPYAALLAAALSPTLAYADVQVSYTIDDTALKAAVSRTVLTFELWGDASCTTAVASSPVAIDDVDVIERLKRFKPRGGARPPRTAR